MRSLITGGAGFIGSHLADELLRRGGEVRIIDDLSTGSLRNIQQARASSRCRVVIDRVENESVLAEMIDGCDIVYHLAGVVGVKRVMQSPLKTLGNVRTTEIVLRIAARQSTKVLFASTSEVYGKSSHWPLQESADICLGPSTSARWSYACSKAAGEFLALSYCREEELPVVLVRLFNTIGPRQTGQFGMVVPSFIRRALRGEPLLVHGDGSQTRAFTCVKDVVRALIDLAVEEQAVGTIFNIGGLREVTILELAQIIKEMTGSSSEISFVPYSCVYGEGFDDVPRRLPDVTKLRSLLGYQPDRELRQILEDMIAHERKGLSSSAADSPEVFTSNIAMSAIDSVDFHAASGRP
jgi:UDP-glucose 4-epimerase